MSQLRQLQLHFINTVYEKDAPNAEEFIAASDGRGARASLQVYKDSVLGNLTNALGDIYPCLKKCVGESFFNAMAKKYIIQHPSRSSSLDDYGEHMPTFLQHFSPLADLPYAGDLATLEWCWHRAFHAVDERPLSPQGLERKLSQYRDDNSSGDSSDLEDTSNLRFSLLQSVALIDSVYPLFDIWRLCADEGEESEVLTSERPGQVNLTDNSHQLIIWRDLDFNMCVQLLSQMQFDVLTLMKKQESMGTIFEVLGSKHAPEEINQVFVDAMALGWLVDH